MILIADSGSTKTDWIVVDKGTISGRFVTQGINPFFQANDAIVKVLENELLPELGQALRVPEFDLHYYGAGCSTTEKCAMVKAALQQVFPHATIQVEHDLLAAARALCGKEKGIAAILGTGSNSCVFDGEHIIANNPSLGFIMGDEGSGGHIGKELLKMFMYNELQEKLRKDLVAEYGVTKDIILNKVYHEPMPNRYCASFMPFVVKHKADQQILELVSASFGEFFKRHITKYVDHQLLPMHCIGSVALMFTDVLKHVGSGHGVKVQRIIQAPMDGLVGYHTMNATS